MITPKELRHCASCVYLAANPKPAEAIANHLNRAADYIESLLSKIAEYENRQHFCGECGEQPGSIVVLCNACERDLRSKITKQ